MAGEFETGEALKRAATRALFHLMRAAVESLRAVEAVVEELGSVGKGGSVGPADPPQRIEIE